MNTSEIRQAVSRLCAERNIIEQELLKTRNKMVRGSIVPQMRKCSLANCSKCTKGEKHGPFLYLSTVINGKSIHKYIGKEKDNQLVSSLKRYKAFKDNISRINKIHKELGSLWQQYREQLTVEITDNGLAL